MLILNFKLQTKCKTHSNVVQLFSSRKFLASSKILGFKVQNSIYNI